MSSMEFNKLSGAILLGGLIAMMTGFIAEVLVEPSIWKRTLIMSIPAP